MVNAAKKLFHLYYRDDGSILLSVVKTGAPPPWTFIVVCIVLANLIYNGVFGAALIRIWRKRMHYSVDETFLLVMLLLVSAFYLVYFGADRFHQPLIPIFAGFAFMGSRGSPKTPN
jgi:hypothetical protein